VAGQGGGIDGWATTRWPGEAAMATGRGGDNPARKKQWLWQVAAVAGPGDSGSLVRRPQPGKAARQEVVVARCRQGEGGDGGGVGVRCRYKVKYLPAIRPIYSSVVPDYRRI
jgi:hypothetical protein